MKSWLPSLYRDDEADILRQSSSWYWWYSALPPSAFATRAHSLNGLVLKFKACSKCTNQPSRLSQTSENLVIDMNLPALPRQFRVYS